MAACFVASGKIKFHENCGIIYPQQDWQSADVHGASLMKLGM